MTTLDSNGRSQALLAAWTTHVLERILAHDSESVELSSPFVAQLTGRGDGVLRGKAGLRDYFARGLKAYPTLRFGLMRLYAGVGGCVPEYHSVNGLRPAELLEFDAQGRVRRVLAHDADEPQNGMRR